MPELPPTATVSVVIPTFNRSSVLGRALQSVFRQTEPPLEILVVDDGSTDGTATTLGPLRNRVRLLVHETRQGAAAARNTALQVARGEFVAFLDSDDEWDPHFLEVMSSRLRHNPEAPLAYCRVLNHDGDRWHPFPAEPFREDPDWLWRRTRIPTLSSVMVRRERVGSMDTGFAILHDRRWYHDVRRAGPFISVDKCLTVRHHESEGLTRNLESWRRETVRYLSAPSTPALAAQVGGGHASVAIMSYAAAARQVGVGLQAAWNLLPRYPLGILWAAGRRLGKYSPSLRRGWGGQSLTLFVTNRCNLTCTHCFYGNQLNLKRQELGLCEIADALGALPLGSHVTFTGGEPLLRADFKEILAVTQSTGTVRSVTIASHGAWPRLSRPLNALFPKHYRIPTELQLSLDGLGATHDRIRGKAGAFEATLEYAQSAVRSRKDLPFLSVGAHFTIHGENVAELGPLATQLRARGIPLKVSFFYDRSQVYGLPREWTGAPDRLSTPGPSPRPLTSEERAQVIAWARSRRGGNLSPLQVRKLKAAHSALIHRKRPLPCYAGSVDWVVYENGDVSLCENTPPVGNVRLSPLGEVQTGAKATLHRAQTRSCACTKGCNLVTSLKRRPLAFRPL